MHTRIVPQDSLLQKKRWRADTPVHLLFLPQFISNPLIIIIIIMLNLLELSLLSVAQEQIHYYYCDIVLQVVFYVVILFPFILVISLVFIFCSPRFTASLYF